MLLSCKISHAFFTYLERHGVALTRLEKSRLIDFDGEGPAGSLPIETWRDSSAWVEAEKMESFLAFVSQLDLETLEGDILENVALQIKDLRSWGALDSVLRMMPGVRDFYAQPARLLSYFIHPAPIVEGLNRTSDSVEFTIVPGLSRYTQTTAFIKACFEALPTYIGKPLATVEWSGERIKISWQERQVEMGTRTDPAQGLSLNPDLIRNILVNLQDAQKEVQDLKFKLAQNKSADGLYQNQREAIEKEIFRLNDYWTRAEQVIKVIMASSKNDPQVRETLRRTDWESLKDRVKHATSQLLRLVNTNPDTVEERILDIEPNTEKQSQLDFRGLI